MVYCGKPSRGCQMCRTRRIKCDETKPTCNQCAKSRRQCPGYKDEFDLVFRNETGVTVRRAQKASKRAEKAAAEGRAGSVWGPSASASGPVPVGGAGFVKPGQPGSVLPMEGMMGTMGSMAMGNGAAGGPTPGKRYSVSAGSVGSAASPVFDTSGSGTMSPVDVRFEALTPSSDASFGDGVMVVGSGGLVSFADGQVSPVSWGAQQMQMMQEQQEQDQQKQQLEMVLRQPDQPVEVVAECHFLSNFVLMPRQGTTRGFMDYIVPLLNGPGTTSHLRMALRACGLASLNNREKSVQNLVMRSALLEYAKALQETRKIIADKTEALSDATLATTLLLGMFENITAQKLGMMAWGSHVTGAIQIALQRSIKSRKTDVGRNLFIAVRTQMIVLALASGKWFGNDVDWWMQDSVGDETAAQCQRICIRTAELRSEVNRLMALERNANTIEMMYDLIRRAQLIDQDCIRWTNNVPEYWKHWTAKWVDNVPGGDYAKAEVFPGPVHLYTDFWIASVWNMLRASRLALASVIVRCAAWTRAPANYRTTPEYATASRVAVETINDIISSVPYHLGWHLGRKDLIIQRQNLSGFACGSEGSPKGLAGYFISWPLTLVYGQDYTTDAQRRWVLGRFRHIADVLGIQYTRILSAINVRLPSMLIEADGLKRDLYPESHNFEQIVSKARNQLPPTPGYALNPLQQREQMHLRQREQQRDDLVLRAAGRAGESGRWIATKVLAAS